MFSSRGRGTGFAGPQAQRPPRGAVSYAKRTTVGAISATSSHHVEELVVVLGRFHVFQHEFHRLDLVHVVHELAQNSRLLQNLWRQQQLFLAGAASVQVNGREDAFLVQAAVQMDFAVAGALEFFKNHLVHAAAGVDQGGANDGQAAAFLDLAGRAEKALGALQCVGVHAAGQYLAR